MSVGSPRSESIESSLPIVSSPRTPGDGSKPTIMIVGNPNAGKTTLFNRLTGLRAQTGNFPGTTVERRSCEIALGDLQARLVDLPGLYSLESTAPDERVACAAIRGDLPGELPPDVVALVLDATNLQRNLFLASQVLELKVPVVVVLSMVDLAEKQGLQIDRLALSKQLACPVVATSARLGRGVDELLTTLHDALNRELAPHEFQRADCGNCRGCHYAERYDWAERVGAATVHGDGVAPSKVTEAIDRYLTHRAVGLIAFAGIMFVVFSVLFWAAQFPMDWIDSLFGAARSVVEKWLPEGDLRSLLADGLVSGVGGVVIFLPQICLLFFLLALLEDSGYLARAAFVMDRLMAWVGLPGKAFVPLLSAHACAIPAIMATRVIEDRRDRLATIFVVPLMTCSARIPVYAMVTSLMFSHAPLIASGVFVGAYALGIVTAMATAWIFKQTFLPGKAQPLVIELPNYRRPSLRNALMLTWDRALVFLKSAGTTILLISLVLWALATYPKVDLAQQPQEIQTEVAQLHTQGRSTEAEQIVGAIQLENSAIGRLGRGMEPVFAPLGFDWKIGVGVLSSFAAREVLVSTLAVLHGLADDSMEGESNLLVDRLRSAKRPNGEPVFSLPACLSLLTFYALAMQCFPTQVVVRRETGGWKLPLLQFGYMSSLAYLAALAVYQVSSRMF